MSSRPISSVRLFFLLFLAWLSFGDVLVAQGPPPPPPPPGGGGIPPLTPVPEPAQHPSTTEEEMLGKFLFWETQLSQDRAVSCGTCHFPEAGGSDPRTLSEVTRHPGSDGVLGTPDDIMGSIGSQSQNCDGTILSNTFFGTERQVTNRKSQSTLGAMYSPNLFWDGRIGPQFINPETGAVSIPGAGSGSPAGGALEAQAIDPILSEIEMGCDSRSWDDVRARLLAAVPLQYSTNIPVAMASTLAQFPDYSALFTMAFGTPTITAERIAFAIAAYERTLNPDQTPFDLFLAGNPNAMSNDAQQGFNRFQNACLPCHGGPFLSDNVFHDIGVRPENEDLGRFLITGNNVDRGRFKTPPLRNVELRAPYFHNGGKETLLDVVNFYNGGGDFQNPEQGPGTPPLGLPLGARLDIVEFLEALTDPRAEQGLPPFDHPSMPVYFRRGDVNSDGVMDISDAIGVLQYLFDGLVVNCDDAADANDDGEINISDAVRLLSRLFNGGEPLPAPSESAEGPDLTIDQLECLN